MPINLRVLALCLESRAVRRAILLLGLVIGALTPGCGSSAQKSVGLGASADLAPALDCRQASSLDDGPMVGLGLDGALPDLRHVPAESLHVTLPGKAPAASRVKSLCDLLRGTGKTLLVLQFVSVKCYACMKWVEQANADLSAQNLGDEVLTVAVVEDPETELTDAELVTLSADVAANATWARDPDRTLWNFFATAPTADAPVVPLAIVMDWAARGFYCDQKSTPLATLVSVADQLMGWTIGQGTSTSSGTGTGTATASATATVTASGTGTGTAH
jgi:hypothetical protein